VSERSYRSTVLASALVWFLLGLHAPIVHQVTHHHRMPDTTALVVVALLAIAGVATVLALLRAPASVGRGGGGAPPSE
jgi:hypothetical protein